MQSLPQNTLNDLYENALNYILEPEAQTHI